MTCKWVLFSAYYAYNFFFPDFFLFWDMWGLLKMAMHACFAISGQQIFFFLAESMDNRFEVCYCHMDITGIYFLCIHIWVYFSF